MNKENTKIKMDIKQMRSILYGLDPSNKEHLALYYHILQHMQVGSEGKISYAYYDLDRHKPRRRVNEFTPADIEALPPGAKITVGLGFNMEQGKQGKVSKDIWKGAFEDTISFDAVFKGEKDLTEEQINRLYQACIQDKEKILRNRYEEKIWNSLHFNERAVLVDLDFQAGNKYNLKGTELHTAITQYYTEGNEASLKEAVQIIKKFAEGAKTTGNRNRRNSNAILLSSYEEQTYHRPFEPLREREINGTLNSTIIPRSLINSHEIGVQI